MNDRNVHLTTFRSWRLKRLLLPAKRTPRGHGRGWFREALLFRITAPLLSLHGSPPAKDYEAWLTRLVPSARVEVWDGTGHMLYLFDSERFAKRFSALLSESGG